MQIIGCSTLAIILACGVTPGSVGAATQYRPQEFNCAAAGKLAKQGDAAQTAGDAAQTAGDAAQTAGDDERSVKFWQQAIEAYELCDNATNDDRENEVHAMISVAAQFQTDGDISKARSMYTSAALRLNMLCIESEQLSSLAHVFVGLELNIYRKYAGETGAPPVDACDGPFAQPTPTP